MKKIPAVMCSLIMLCCFPAIAQENNAPCADAFCDITGTAPHTPLALEQDQSPDQGSDFPSKITRTGHEFRARCSDEDFATARFPDQLYGRCIKLLQTWRYEATRKDPMRLPPTGGIEVPTVPNLFYYSKD